MIQRVLLFAAAGFTIVVAGCQGPCATCGPGLFGNVNGTRIAPPATGSIQYPQQVANLPDPYYGNRASSGSTPNVNQGWRPANPAAGTPNPVQFNPNAGAQSVPRNSIPQNNLVASSSTSTIQPRNTTLASATTAQPIRNTTPVVAASPGTGGMPLNDATRVAAAGPTPFNTGIFNRRWEYIAPIRPTNQRSNPNQFVNQPVYANGSIVASAANNPGLNRPRPGSYSNNYQYVNGYPQQNGIIAEGWRQRDVSR